MIIHNNNNNKINGDHYLTCWLTAAGKKRWFTYILGHGGGWWAAEGGVENGTAEEGFGIFLHFLLQEGGRVL